MKRGPARSLDGRQRVGRPEPAARAHRQPGVPGVRRIGPRAIALDEQGAAIGHHRPRVPAAGAEAGGRRQLPLVGTIVHDEPMFTSEATTRGVRVAVVSEYAAGRSRPQEEHWFFLYTITITNLGAEPVQLVSRHWIVTNAKGETDEFRGRGVVGEQPVLGPSESFTYTSGCPLATPFGTMEGTYQMVTRGGDEFEVRIAPFTLSEPYTIH
jgi:ApaG protein